MNGRFRRTLGIVMAACMAAGYVGGHAHAADADKPWAMHVIDNSSVGADGVRLADVNGDGLADITTAWEEGGVVRVYVNPGPKKAKQKWPAVTVGKVKSGEDAVFADLDGDGAIDVVSSCEGKTRTMFVHWAPKDKTKYLDESAWKTEPFPATQGKQMWMFCLPMDVDGQHGVDLIVGSKNKGAIVGWLESPANPRDVSAWKLHAKYKAGWIMSLIPADMDDDGDLDVILSDRKGSNRGVHWLELPKRDAVSAKQPWKRHLIGRPPGQIMFVAAERRLGRWFVATAAKQPSFIGWYVGQGDKWERIGGDNYPHDRFGGPKAIRMADMTGDGRRELVVTCESATGDKSGVYLVTITGHKWQTHDIGGPKGVKYDRIELLDLDADGDLDVLTCEERDNLGVIWYENPAR